MKGQCYCGALRYEAAGDPVFKGQCHCRECQYVSGGHPNVVMAFPEAGFKYSKGTSKTFKRKDLPNPVAREFCAECGTGLTAAEAAPAPAAATPVAERRVVTVRFADLFGFTSASSERERSIERRFLALPSADRARQAHAFLTAEPHVAGTPRDRALADWIRDRPSTASGRLRRCESCERVPASDRRPREGRRETVCRAGSSRDSSNSEGTQRPVA